MELLIVGVAPRSEVTDHESATELHMSQAQQYEMIHNSRNGEYDALFARKLKMKPSAETILDKAYARRALRKEPCNKQIDEDVAASAGLQI